MRLVLGAYFTAVNLQSSNEVGIVIDYDHANFVVAFDDHEESFPRKDINTSLERYLVDAIRNDVYTVSEMI